MRGCTDLDYIGSLSTTRCKYVVYYGVVAVTKTMKSICVACYLVDTLLVDPCQKMNLSDDGRLR